MACNSFPIETNMSSFADLCVRQKEIPNMTEEERSAFCLNNGWMWNIDRRSSLRAYDSMEQYKNNCQIKESKRCRASAAIAEGDPSGCCHTLDGATLGNQGNNDHKTALLCHGMWAPSGPL